MTLYSCYNGDNRNLFCGSSTTLKVTISFIYIYFIFFGSFFYILFSVLVLVLNLLLAETVTVVEVALQGICVTSLECAKHV